MSKVFISHSHRDREFVEREIIAPLDEHGIESWYAKDEIESGAIWERQIHEALETCDWFLVVLTPDAVASERVQAEVDLALEKLKDRVVPVLCGELTAEDLPLKLRDIEHYDFTRNIETERKWLLRKLSGVASTTAQLYGEAQAACAQEDWTTAIAKLQTLLQSEPHHAAAHALLQQAQTATRINALLLAADAATAKENWPVAINKLEEILSLKPDHAEAQRKLQEMRRQQKPLYADENVQFTVYRPVAVAPMRWSLLLAFAHLSTRRPDAPPDEPDPLEAIKRIAERVLADEPVEYSPIGGVDSLHAVPHGDEITFVPSIEGFEFNPPSQSFFWQKSWHKVEFEMRAAPALEGRVARGRLTVFLGSLILADVPLAISVTRDAQTARPTAPASATPYRKIFASYSHNDREIVEQIEHHIQALGDKYLRDVRELRSGQDWQRWMREAIAEADIFQLFWSHNAMRSTNVRKEWEYALSLARPHFVRPIYWETPLPESPTENLPPDDLRRLHFQHLRPGLSTHPPAQQTQHSAPTATRAATPAMPIMQPAAPMVAAAPAPSEAMTAPTRAMLSFGSAPQSPPMPTARPAKRIKWLGLAVAAVLLAFIIAPIYLFTFSTKSLSTNANVSNTNTYVLVSPTPTPTVIAADDPLKTQVQANLTKYGITGVTVTVVNGEVTLTGDLPRAKLPDAQKAANEAHPKKVNNKLNLK
jgi:tetratricopeptide (TPR) repeat protein